MTPPCGERSVVALLAGISIGALGCYMLLQPLLVSAAKYGEVRGRLVAETGNAVGTTPARFAPAVSSNAEIVGRGPSSPPPPQLEPRVVIAVVETRFCEPVEKKPRWKNDYKHKRNMRRWGAAINLNYAKKHGYEFRMYCRGDSHGFANAWLKVSLLEGLFEEAKQFAVPSYVLLIDSDTYVRATETKLPDWMKGHGVDFAQVPWSLMYSQESVVEGKFKEPGRLNTGAAYGYINPADVQRTRDAIAALALWRQAACGNCTDYQTEDKHPWEQGCLERLLDTSPQIQQTVNVSMQHMNTWNGPWGAYLRHAWGGPGKEVRNWVFEDMVLTHLIDVDESINAVLTNHLGPNITFDAGCIPTPPAREINTN
jgi:hypothetical protein